MYTYLAVSLYVCQSFLLIFTHTRPRQTLKFPVFEIGKNISKVLAPTQTKHSEFFAAFYKHLELLTLSCSDEAATYKEEGEREREEEGPSA